MSKVDIETKERAVIILLKEIVRKAREYNGAMNNSYTFKNPHYIQMDQNNKNHLRGELAKILPAGFVIGTGSSHIWVAKQTGSDVGTREAVAIGGIHDRVLLITDAN